MPSIESNPPEVVILADVSTLSPTHLVEQASKPENVEVVRAEVYRRLKDDPHKANLFTFRWLLPADENDKEDAFDGLMAVCWIEVCFRHAGSKRNTDRTRDAITDALVDSLYLLKSLEPSEVIRRALDFGFDTDKDVANAVRRRTRQERKNEPLESDETMKLSVEPLPEETNVPFIELLDARKDGVVEVLGERGWEVLWSFVETLADDQLPSTERERERVLTSAIAAKRGVSERQARTDKGWFRSAFKAALEAGSPALREIAALWKAKFI